MSTYSVASTIPSSLIPNEASNSPKQGESTTLQIRVVPLPFFPSFLKTIAKILPFGYVSDIPFRIYTSNINMVAAKECIIIQLIWILIITLIGYILSKIALKKAVIQGG